MGQASQARHARQARQARQAGEARQARGQAGNACQAGQARPGRQLTQPGRLGLARAAARPGSRLPIANKKFEASEPRLGPVSRPGVWTGK